MQISDTAAVKTGLACSTTVLNMVKPPFAVGKKIVSKLKATNGKEGEILQVSGSSRSRNTVSDGTVEQYPRRRKRVHVSATPTYQYFRLHALESVKLSDPA